MKGIKSLGILSFGIFLGISSLLFTNIVTKNGFPQFIHADDSSNKNTIPFICPNCNINNDATRFGNRLKGKDLTNSWFPNSTIEGGFDFSNTVLKNANIFDSLFNGDIFTNADLSGAYVQSTSFSNINGAYANFNKITGDGTDWSGSTLQNATFVNAIIGQASFTSANLTGANFTNAKLISPSNSSSSSFSHSNLTNANFTNADLTNSDLTGATLTGAILTNVSWHNTTCPDGTNSDSDSNTCVGHF